MQTIRECLQREGTRLASENELLQRRVETRMYSEGHFPAAKVIANEVMGNVRS